MASWQNPHQPVTDHIELRLPIFGFRLQWRSTEKTGRALPDIYGDDLASLAEVEGSEDSWQPWTGNAENWVSSHFEAEAYEREHAWWLVFGELDEPDGDVHVTLTDDTTPKIDRLGPLFAAEWISQPLQATVTRNHLRLTVDFHRPGLMVAGLRYKRSEPNPTTGWIRQAQEKLAGPTSAK
jgi:hypothetical protein